MKEERKIKVVLLEPGEIARAAEIEASLENMQRIVGGCIEAYYPFEEQVCIVCNDEGNPIIHFFTRRADCRAVRPILVYRAFDSFPGR